MLQLEKLASQRWPAWFMGRRARLTRPLLQGVSRWTGLDAVAAFVAEHPHLHGLEFVEGALRFLDVRYRVDDLERQRIPLSGPCLVVANHPLGGLDALALLKLVGDLRRDVRIVANDWLAALEPLAPLLLPVRVFGGRTPGADLEQIDSDLAAGRVVIIFPAGAVARMGWTGLRDRDWRTGFVRFAARSGAPVLPVHIGGRNSLPFYAGAALSESLGTAMLARQVFARRRRCLDIHIDRPLPIAAVHAAGPGARELARQLQQQVATLAQEPHVGAHRAEAVAHPLGRELLPAEIARLPELGRTPDGKRIVLLSPGSSSLLLRELARLRELSFRAVGEGTGAALDWDRYDASYDQLILWDDSRQRIAGGYRFARCAEIRARHGQGGLYTSSLFDYGDGFAAQMAQGLELGRSFVVPEYWGSRSLDYLWYGIGAYLRRHPELRYLFGSVSISASMGSAARDLLVAWYTHYYGDSGHRVRALYPYPPTRLDPDFDGLDAMQGFRLLREKLAALGARVPALFKHYVDLCAPGGASFLAFGIDRQFSDAVDGLILVDLDRILPGKRRRYLEPATSQAEEDAA